MVVFNRGVINVAFPWLFDFCYLGLCLYLVFVVVDWCCFGGIDSFLLASCFLVRCIRGRIGMDVMWYFFLIGKSL